MAKNKFYAVKIGRKTGIFSSWDETKESVLSYPGAVYKGFSTLKEANSFLSGEEKADKCKTDSKSSENDFIDQIISSLDCETALAFSDGSFDKNHRVTSYGVLLFFRKNTYSLSSSFTEKTSLSLVETWNVGGELEGVKAAVNKAIALGAKKLLVYYDYMGIECWANGSWKAKNPIAENYQTFINEKQKQIELEFHKVKAHTGIRYNEEVDRLAKEALKKDEDGIYFTED